MYTNDGERRRSKGGVFLKHLETEVGAELVKPIFTANTKKKKQAAAKRQKVAQEESLK